jgi:hypothetical protein
MQEPAWRRYERFHDDDVDADLNDEFSAHLALLVDHHLAAGLPPDAAESAARAAFANAPVAMEECRKLTVARLARRKRDAQVARLRADVRHVLRDASSRPADVLALIGGVAALVAASAVFSALLQL